MKITEIKQTKKIPKTRRDANGVETKVIEEVEVSRKIKVISGGARFGHYLLDVVCVVALAFLLNAAGLHLLEDGRMSSFYFNSNGGGFQVNYSGYLITLVYYGLFESITGSTPGKMLLGRVVIDEYAKKPDFVTILLRSLFRIIPFEAFSCLGERGWHDSWSRTWVVSKAEQAALKKAIGEEDYLDDEILDI